VMEKILAVD